MRQSPTIAHTPDRPFHTPDQTDTDTRGQTDQTPPWGVVWSVWLARYARTRQTRQPQTMSGLSGLSGTANLHGASPCLRDARKHARDSRSAAGPGHGDRADRHPFAHDRGRATCESCCCVGKARAPVRRRL